METKTRYLRWRGLQPRPLWSAHLIVDFTINQVQENLWESYIGCQTPKIRVICVIRVIRDSDEENYQARSVCNPANH